MKFELNIGKNALDTTELIILSAKQKNKKLDISHWNPSDQKNFTKIKSSNHFKGEKNEYFFFNRTNGVSILVIGLGNSNKLTLEELRKIIAKSMQQIKNSNKQIEIILDHFIPQDQSPTETLRAISESILMSLYSFTEFKKSPSLALKKIIVQSKMIDKKEGNKILRQNKIIVDAINVSRDFSNLPPNILNSEEFAKRIVEDAKKLPNVKVKLLRKKDLKKEKMNLFLSVNAGSAYEPQLVHLEYTPQSDFNKHIALVGKGLTFDSGGYSLKPSTSMAGMKFDMTGAATVYGAFRAAVMLNAKTKISCFLGITDNMVNSNATVPDSVVVARNGKSVEILNTDAEGRLVLADVLDYACDQSPDQIIDAATLTGAVLVSLGHEICGVMGNNQELIKNLLNAAKQSDEYMWQLPIIPEFHEDIKSEIADIKNIGGSRFGGSAKAGAFLENFIKKDIAWAHLDIAGIADSQGHLPYCPAKGASGLIIRTLIRHLTDE